MLHWVVQNNLYKERGYDVLVETIERFSLPHTFVKVIPFSHELIPPVEASGNKIIMGSTTLGKLAEKGSWYPGNLMNENFHYSQWREHLGNHLLSPDLVVSSLGDANPITPRFFIRPCHDDKSFAGSVMTYEDFKEWQTKVIDLKETYTTLDASTEVCYGPVQEIYWEGRFWIVDGEIISQSRYKLGRRVTYSEEVPPEATTFVKRMIAIWNPHEAFCIDVAQTPQGYKVIEIGCLNSCGFYACNVQKLVLTLHSFYEGKGTHP